jgi:hypothetical protein
MAVIEVRPGQTWADNDRRAEGRTIRVERIHGGKAVCVILTNRTAAQEQLDAGSAWVTDMRGRMTRISLSRFRPDGSGYRLISDAPEGAEQ